MANLLEIPHSPVTGENRTGRIEYAILDSIRKDLEEYSSSIIEKEVAEYKDLMMKRSSKEIQSIVEAISVVCHSDEFANKIVVDIHYRPVIGNK